MKLIRWMMPALFATASLLAANAQAVDKEDLPFDIPGGKYVKVDEAKKLFDSGVLVIDARKKAEYVEKHIKGAKNVVYDEKFKMVSKTDPADKFDMSKLPAKKDTPMMFHCNGTPCWKGYKGAAAAIAAGYTKVYWFRDGMPAWVAAGHPTE